MAVVGLRRQCSTTVGHNLLSGVCTVQIVLPEGAYDIEPVLPIEAHMSFETKCVIFTPIKTLGLTR